MDRIRLSIGSASVLGLSPIRAKTDPTTCYVMTYTEIPCAGRCAFCPQGNLSLDQNPNLVGSTDKLSRIIWPEYDFKAFIEALEKNQFENSLKRFRRVCLQTLNYPDNLQDALTIIQTIHNVNPNLKISSAFPPINKNSMILLKKAGLERIGIALDACTPALFQKTKGIQIQGPYSWDSHWQCIKDALSVFGNGYVSTHLIIGLGESEEEAIQCIRQTIMQSILPGIFLFTPVKGSKMEKEKRPPIIQFRHIQLMRFMLLKDIGNHARFLFHQGTLIKIHGLTKDELRAIISQGTAFKTAGCPDCNRPYYTSGPSQEPDGFPCDLTKQEEDLLYSELQDLIDQ